GMRELREPMVVLTDAQELFAPDAIRLLIERLFDPRVGAVSGAVRMIDAHTGFSRNLGAHWTYECWLRRNESASGSTMGASGAIYAIRRSCFRSLPEDTILDDVAVPFEILRQGYLVKYEPRALAFEYATADAGQEYARKRRTLAGNYQLISRYRDLLWHRQAAFRFWSHKVFRLLVPYALLGAFIGTFGLPPVLLQLSLGAHIVFYGLALLAFIARRRIRLSLLSFPYTFCVLNWAAIAGSYDYLSGRQRGLWERSK
ncbi:MAG TPA: glycosyltransferase family 2 protein, partial [Acidiferrobacteraceae bacterium]|nr:glycosyltransferase family 2 protein [Acidiferrobacteraceae bacterium]